MHSGVTTVVSLCVDDDLILRILWLFRADVAGTVVVLLGFLSFCLVMPLGLYCFLPVFLQTLVSSPLVSGLFLSGLF
jgi:hypothetical protein